MYVNISDVMLSGSRECGASMNLAVVSLHCEDTHFYDGHESLTRVSPMLHDMVSKMRLQAPTVNDAFRLVSCRANVRWTKPGNYLKNLQKYLHPLLITPKDRLQHLARRKIRFCASFAVGPEDFEGYVLVSSSAKLFADSSHT